MYENGYMIYVDILTGENVSSIYWSVRSTTKRGGDGVKGENWRFRYFSQLRASLYQSA